MKILIVAATPMEVKMIANELEIVNEKSHLLKEYQFDQIPVDILITGIGTTFTTFHLTNALNENTYNLVINVGIAGSLTQELEIGQVVSVASDEFADLGIEEKDEFLTLFETGYIGVNDYPFENGSLKASQKMLWPGVRKVRAITSNRSFGRENSIAEIREKYSAHIESMEGAAVFYVCNWLGVSCCQLRAVSHFVEPRDSSKWNIPLALENLKEETLSLVKNEFVAVN